MDTAESEHSRVFNFHNSSSLQGFNFHRRVATSICSSQLPHAHLHCWEALITSGIQNRCSLGIPKIKIDLVFFLKKFLKVHERVRSVREINAKEIEGKAREVRSALGSLLALRVYPPEGIGMCAAHREPRPVSAAPNAQLSTAARRK